MISSSNQFKKIPLPFKAHLIEPYTLWNGRLLLISESWNYCIFDKNTNSITSEGKFPEKEKYARILGLYSRWFTQCAPGKILYYSKTSKCNILFNLETNSQILKWPGKYSVLSKPIPFIWMNFIKSEKKCEILHCGEEEISIYEVYEGSKQKRDIAKCEIEAPNMMFERNNILVFANQVSNPGCFGFHLLQNGRLFNGNFQFSGKKEIVDFGILNDYLFYFVYNSNDQVEGGIFFSIINNGGVFSQNIRIREGENNCRKVVLIDQRTPDIFGGRVKIDHRNMMISIAGMVNFLIILLRKL